MGYFDDDPEFHKRKKRCRICGAGFHWERGYTVHMSFHEHGVIGNDGHQTNEQKIKQSYPIARSV